METTIKEIENSLGGRPKKENKSKKIRTSVYLQEKEHQQLKTYCEKYHLPISQYVRLLILKNLDSLV